MSTLSLDGALKIFHEITENPIQFLNTDKQISDRIKTNIKEVYDFTKQQEVPSKTENSLPKLFIKNSDFEQIWQQIEIQNEKVVSSFINKISFLLVGEQQLRFNNLTSDQHDRNEDDNSSQSEEQDEDSSDDDMQLSDNKKENVSVDAHSTNPDSDTDDSSSDNENTTERKKGGDSVVDDNFFQLSEMEDFLNKEEKKLADPYSGNHSDSSDSDEEGNINLFGEDSEEDTEHEDEAKTARFKDYFVAKDEPKKLRKNKLLDELMENNDTSSEEGSGEKLKSSLEMRQERLKRKIDELEDRAVSEKPWQLKGEITAENRPQNSLLEDIVGFDLTSRPAPVITEQTSLQLEDIIKQRIKDKVFDSVERKQKPIETPLEYRKKLVLDQEKSKESLAQIYEKEYNKQQAELDPNSAEREEEEPELHKEVKTLMRSLFAKLDALSNCHFTSKPAVPELKIVSNLPAINMEEVAPVVASDAALLAPEEIRKKPKGDIIGKGERTTTQKKRDRRKKKLKQKIIGQLKAKKESLKNSIANKKSKTYGKKR